MIVKHILCDNFPFINQFVFQNSQDILNSLNNKCIAEKLLMAMKQNLWPTIKLNFSSYIFKLGTGFSTQKSENL